MIRVALITLLCLLYDCYSAIWYVSTNGVGSGTNGWEDSCEFQYALDNCQPYDTIILSNNSIYQGTYVCTQEYVNITSKDKDKYTTTILSRNDEDDSYFRSNPKYNGYQWAEGNLVVRLFGTSNLLDSVSIANAYTNNAFWSALGLYNNYCIASNIIITSFWQNADNAFILNVFGGLGDINTQVIRNSDLFITYPTIITVHNGRRTPLEWNRLLNCNVYFEVTHPYTSWFLDGWNNQGELLGAFIKAENTIFNIKYTSAGIFRIFQFTNCIFNVEHNKNIEYYDGGSLEEDNSWVFVRSDSWNSILANCLINYYISRTNVYFDEILRNAINPNNPMYLNNTTVYIKSLTNDSIWLLSNNISFNMANTIIWLDATNLNFNILGDPSIVASNSLSQIFTLTNIISIIQYNCKTDNPMFYDAANSNFDIYQDSPCVNAGDNNSAITVKDILGRHRIINGIIDIGAYENQGGIRFVQSVNTNLIMGSSSNKIRGIK